MNNRDTEYELLVARILQGMLKYDGFENLHVEHDVVLTGKSGATHQIDVFWEFKAAGTIYRTCVECKNYASAVKKLHVAAFSATLADIGNANGIIATTHSFQKGAKLLAQQNNIRLVLINNLIKTIHIVMHPQQTNFTNLSIIFNQESVREALGRRNLEHFSIELRSTGEHPLLGKNGEVIETFNSILNKHSNKQGRNRIDDVNLFLDVDELGPVLIDSIEFDVTHIKLPPMESVITSPNSANAVIEDIVDENRHYIHDDGSVNQVINNT
ncbi:restriction endonuclease [Mariprofundus ferrooxydans]|uniref:restriction endonuclease n=1 Tax=Mariprofundus ferrooxydans TaxID=314344 RepID=UPI0018CA1FAA|nr:restriction endonuclease [Mariprofundus ferrooxydans]